MDAVRLLWIDLCSQPSDRWLFKSLPDGHETAWVDQSEKAVRAAKQFCPHLACIEFDYPDRGRLQAVPTLKRTFPALPLLMFTEYHSEALAVWAFRSGVLDYRVKPVTNRTLARLIEAVLAGAKSRAQGLPLHSPMPEDLVEPAGHLQRPPSTARRTSAAVAYIARHFEQDVKRVVLADVCHLSPSQFTRAFRNEQGITFERFLLEYRIAMARGYLAEPRMTVSQACYSAGFNDKSYFSRVFKQLSGFTPSEYQQCVQPMLARSETRDNRAP